MKLISIALSSAAMIVSAVAFASPPLTGEAINGATFEEWLKTREAAPAVLELDPQTGEVEASDNPAIERPANPGEADTTPVPVPGEPNVVVETPQESTDVPDEARAQVAHDSEVLEEAEQRAAQRQAEPDPFLVRLQILLDRAHFSPGVIDGFLGENTRKALAAYEGMRGLPVDGEPDAQSWASLANDRVIAMQTYEITEEDIDGVEAIPRDYGERANGEWPGYRDVTEMVAERFHIDGDLLRLLNANVDLTVAGSKLVVPILGPKPTARIARIVVDKSEGGLRAYDEGNRIVLFSPVTIVEADMPSNRGTLTVATVAPASTYPQRSSSPEMGDAWPLKVPPGPNGPFGDMWIGLSDSACGIHGTANPGTIGKSQSHGCVGMTNWDVNTLAALVEPGRTLVELRE